MLREACATCGGVIVADDQGSVPAAVLLHNRAHGRPERPDPEPPIDAIAELGLRRPDPTWREYVAARLRIEDECWLWKGSLHHGSPRLPLRLGGGSPRRLLYEESRGEVPSGTVLVAACDRPLCCAPAHAEPVDRLEQLRRSRGRLRPPTEFEQRRAEAIRRSFATHR